MTVQLRVTTLAAVLLAASATSPLAQERIELFSTVNGAARILEVDATVSGFGAVRSVTPLTISNYFREGLVALAGGRFVVWPADGGLAVLDRRTRRIVAVPMADGHAISVVADRRQPRIFVRTVSTTSDLRVWVIDARDPTPRLLFSTRQLILGIAHAAATDELFVNLVDSFPLRHSTDVIDATTGALRRRLERSDWLQDLQVSDDGRWLWGITGPFGLGHIDVVDGRTGVRLVHGPTVRSSYALDTSRGLVLAADGDDEFLVAYDALTLVERWRSRLDLPLTMRGHSVEHRLLPGRWMTGAYALHAENRHDGVCQRLDIAVADPDGTRRAAVQLLPFAGATGSPCFAGAVLVRSPFAPGALVAGVAGATVTLTWANPGDTTDFEVEYGFASGQRAGAIRVGAATAVAIPNVPPGTYYVRVTAHNEVGPSPASNEVRVVVQ